MESKPGFKFIGILSLMLAVSCGKRLSDVSGSSDLGSTLPSTPPAAPAVSEASPLSLNMYTVYDGTKAVNSLKFDETATETCTATTTNPSVTCTVTVPEGRLYLSEVNFQFSWLTSKCKILIFQPYYYKASTSASYVAPGSTSAIDCATAPIPSKCYGGAATGLVDKFPKYTSNIYIPDELLDPATVQTKSEKLASAYSLAAGSNRLAVNDLPLAKQATTFTSADLGGVGDGYIGSTYTNYSFVCRDDWYDPVTYQINLNIRDEDSKSGNAVIDNFFTWKEAP